MTTLCLVSLLLVLPAAKGKARQVALKERAGVVSADSPVSAKALLLARRSLSARPHSLRFLARHTNAVLKAKCLAVHRDSPRTWLQAKTWHRLAHRAKRGTCLAVPRWFYDGIMCVHSGIKNGVRVGNGEAADWRYGAPGHAQNGYEGGLQFVHSTWISNGGGRFAYHAYDASPMQQIIVAYQTWKGAGWGSWPNTSRACGLA